MVNKKLLNALKMLIGIAILCYIIFFQMGIQNLLDAISKVNIWYIIAGLIVFLILNFSLSTRAYLMLKKLKLDVSWKDTMFSHMFGMFLSTVTPARMGYFGMAYTLKKKKNIPINDSLSVISYVQAFDFLGKAFGAIVSVLFIILSVGGKELAYIGMLGATMLVVFSIVMLILLTRDLPFIFRIVEKLPFGVKITSFLKDIRESSKKFKGTAPLLFLSAMLFWVIRGLEWYFLGLGCNIMLPFYVFFLLHPVITAAQYVPLSIAGMGFYEGASILGFSLFGVSPESAFLLSIFDRLDDMLLNLLGILEFKEL